MGSVGTRCENPSPRGPNGVSGCGSLPAKAWGKTKPTGWHARLAAALAMVSGEAFPFKWLSASHARSAMRVATTMAGTFALLESASRRVTLPEMGDEAVTILRRQIPSPTRPQRLFYQVFLPLGIVANLVLGVLILTRLRPDGWSGWLLVGTGAFCCLVAGWLSAAAWSKVYWNRSMARQVALWRQIADAFFTWVEDVPLPAESVHRLRAALDRVVPTSERTKG